MSACLNCASCDDALIEIKEGGQKTKALYLCDSCYDEFRMGYILLTPCQGCGTDFMSDNDDGPSLCKTCITFTPPYNIDATEEDYERHGYLTRHKMLIKPEPMHLGRMCMRKALRIYVNSRKNEDKEIMRDRAVTFFRAMKGWPDNVGVVAEMARLAREQQMKPMEYFRLMSTYDRAEEGLDDLVALYKEKGYLAYDALENDQMEEQLHNKPRFYAEYLKMNKETLCLEKDDNFADLPF